MTTGTQRELVADNREQQRAEMRCAAWVQLGALGDQCDSWNAACETGPTRSRASKFSSAQHAAHEARDVFISAAQKHAHPDPGKSAGWRRLRVNPAGKASGR